MQITQEQFERIAGCLPRQRGNVTQDNLQVINALLYIAEHGCKWRGLREVEIGRRRIEHTVSSISASQRRRMEKGGFAAGVYLETDPIEKPGKKINGGGASSLAGKPGFPRRIYDEKNAFDGNSHRGCSRYSCSCR